MSLDMRRLELSDLMRDADGAADAADSPAALLTAAAADFRSVQALVRGASSRGVVINSVLGVMSMGATVLIAVLSKRTAVVDEKRFTDISKEEDGGKRSDVCVCMWARLPPSLPPPPSLSLSLSLSACLSACLSVCLSLSLPLCDQPES